MHFEENAPLGPKTRRRIHALVHVRARQPRILRVRLGAHKAVRAEQGLHIPPDLLRQRTTRVQVSPQGGTRPVNGDERVLVRLGLEIHYHLRPGCEVYQCEQLEPREIAVERALNEEVVVAQWKARHTASNRQGR